MSKPKPILMTDWTVRAIANTKPDEWFADAIDHEKPYKYQTRRNSFKAKAHNFDLNDHPNEWGFFGFSFWAFAQDFTGSTILSILSILAGIVGLIKGFLFDDGF